jgi:hypothetical protein
MEGGPDTSMTTTEFVSFATHAARDLSWDEAFASFPGRARWDEPGYSQSGSTIPRREVSIEVPSPSN